MTRWFRYLTVAADLPLAMAVLAIPLAGIGKWSSHVERLTHFRLYWLAVLASLLIFHALRKDWWRSAIAIALLAWGAVLPIRYAVAEIGPPTAVNESPGFRLRVVTANLRAGNCDRTSFRDWIGASQADIVFFSEFTPDWDHDLGECRDRFPHQIRYPRPGASGVALLSRHPLGEPDASGISSGEDHPWIDTTVTVGGIAVRVVGMHPRTPRRGERFTSRNDQLRHAGAIAANEPGPLIVLGDLNCTPYSPWFRVLTFGGLKDTAMGRSLEATWSDGVFWLPIDHILVSQHWRVISRDVAEDSMGSDHYPVTTELETVQTR